MKNTQINDYERISDLSLIVVLSMFFSAEAIDRDSENTSRVFFLFKKSDALDQLIKSYWKKEVSVEPQAFFNQLKSIKARIYSSQ